MAVRNSGGAAVLVCVCGLLLYCPCAFYNAISLSCSKSFWESLSPELQEIFLTAAKEAGAEQRTWLQTAAADMLSKMEDGGCTIIDDVDVAAFQEACAPVYEAYRDKIGSDLLDRAVAAVQ